MLMRMNSDERTSMDGRPSTDFHPINGQKSMDRWKLATIMQRTALQMPWFCKMPVNSVAMVDAMQQPQPYEATMSSAIMVNDNATNAALQIAKRSATMANDDTMDATLQTIWEFCNGGTQKQFFFFSSSYLTPTASRVFKASSASSYVSTQEREKQKP